MKKRSLLMTLLMLIGFGMASAADVEIGTLETNKLTNQFPVNPYFSYAMTQQIITSAEIGQGGSIMSISFYRDWTSENIDELNLNGLKLYMKATDKTKFNNENDFVTVNESDLVWQGTLSAPAVDYKGWITITLDKPFEYFISNNLLVCFYDSNPGRAAGNTNRFYFVPTTETTGLSYTSNDIVPDLNNLGGFTGSKTIMAAHNYMKLNIGSYFRREVVDNTTHYYLPTTNNWKYSLSQQIYTVEEIGESQTINSISFFSHNNINNRNINLYLVQTDKTSFSDESDYLNFTTTNMVFSGSVNFVSNEWTTINFDVSFTYNNSKNLAIIMQDNTGSFTSSSRFSAYNTDGYSALYSISDNVAVTVSNATQGLHGSLNFKNKIRINEGDVIGDQKAALPTTSASSYTLSEQIYSSSELLGIPNSISSISFYNTGDEVTRNIDLYLKNTTKSSFTGDADWHSSFSASDRVYSGSVTFKHNEWTDIAFDKYFDYNGTDNLIVVCDDNTGDVDENQLSFLAMNCSDNYAISSSESNWNPLYSMSAILGVRSSKKSQIVLNATGLSFKPSVVNVTDVTWNSATVTWESRGSKWNVQYRIDGSDEWIVAAEGTNETSCFLTDLEQATYYEVRVQTDNNGKLSEWTSSTFHTEDQYPRPSDVTVSNITPNSAVVKWKDNCGASAWRIHLFEHVTASQYNDKGIIDAGTTTFVLGGLTP
ncbi:MAG: fibronectin type III domain-containing protein, partial [Bacteroidaceae bacterium]|nr:fibronectin type III domain-containing protein [Bacteroidaceae bacterium]